MHVTTNSPICGFLFLQVFTTPSSTHVRNFTVNLGFYLINWSYYMSFLPPRFTIFSLSYLLYIWDTSLQILYLIYNGKLACHIIDWAHPPILVNRVLARWLIWGFTPPVFKFQIKFPIFSFRCFLYLRFLSGVFTSEIFNQMSIFSHFSKFLHTSLIIPFFVSHK